MPAAPLPDNEQIRIAALQRYEIIDSGSEQEYDDLTQIAAQICQTPTALITLIDQKRQWFKSRVGFESAETPREHAFCAYAIHDTATMVVPDAILDERFADNPLVLRDPRIRFYAGAPLHTSDGVNLGTLCVIDKKPRVFPPEHQRALEALARQVVRLIELRHRNRIFASLVEMSPAAMFVKDSTGRFVFVNAPWTRHFGRSGEQPLGKTVEEWFGSPQGGKLLEDDLAVVRAQKAVESVDDLPSNEGERTWLTVRFPIEGIGRESMVGGFRFDLTRTMLAERVGANRKRSSGNSAPRHRMRSSAATRRRGLFSGTRPRS
jgi:PAS domain S-box-containing protein